MSSMDYERGNQANGCLDRIFQVNQTWNISKD